MDSTGGTDARRLLEELAFLYPEPADLAFEAWVLGMDSERLAEAASRLQQAGYARIDTEEARLTDDGMAAARLLQRSQTGSDRRTGPDRRHGAAMLPPGFADRRHAGADRRAMR